MTRCNGALVVMLTGFYAGACGESLLPSEARSLITARVGDGDTSPDADLGSDAAGDARSDADADAGADARIADAGGDARIVDAGADAQIGDAGLDAPSTFVDAAVDARPDASPPDAQPPPPAACTPEAATTYGDIKVIRQDAPTEGKWVRVAMVSWDSKDATRKATAVRATTDKNDNLAVIDRFAAVAKKQCVDLLIFPELAVVGYPAKDTDKLTPKTANFRSREEAASYIETIPPVGTARANINAANFPSSRRLADAAATNGVALHAGLLENNGDKAKPYNTTLVFGKDGTLVARHRKHNVNDPLPLTAKEDSFFYERDYLSEGADATVYVHPLLGRVGVMTCSDMYPRMNEDGTVGEAAPYWRDNYLAGNAFAFMSVSSAWNDPWKSPFDPEWTAMNQVDKLSAWANPNGAKGSRWIGFSNTVSNGKEEKKGFTALVAPGKSVKVQTDADMTIVIGFVPAAP